MEHRGTLKGNQWARWTQCSHCCLQLEYTPFTNSPAQHPKDVRAALTEIWEAGDFWDYMEAKQMQAKIKAITARKQNRPVKGKGKGKRKVDPVHHEQRRGV